MDCCWQVIDHIENDLSDKIKWEIFSHVSTTIYLHHLDSNETSGEKLDGNKTWMLQGVLNKSWQQCSTEQQLHSHSPPISQAIQVGTAEEIRMNT